MVWKCFPTQWRSHSNGGTSSQSFIQASKKLTLILPPLFFVLFLIKVADLSCVRFFKKVIEGDGVFSLTESFLKNIWAINSFWVSLWDQIVACMNQRSFFLREWPTCLRKIKLKSSMRRWFRPFLLSRLWDKDIFFFPERTLTIFLDSLSGLMQ